MAPRLPVPEQQWRIDLHESAVAAARDDPPTIIRGDAIDDLDAAVAGAPDDAALCVVHTAVMAYLSEPDRFVSAVHDIARQRPVWWVSGEAKSLVPALDTDVPPPRPISFLFGIVELGTPAPTTRAIAYAGSHGAWLQWLDT